jgi:hypothetical protein
MFTCEKEHLLEAVEKIRWNPDDFRSTQYLAQYSAVLYVINTLRDMPGSEFGVTNPALILITTDDRIEVKNYAKLGLPVGADSPFAIFV